MKSKFYFVDIFNDTFCYTKEYIIDMMNIEDIIEVKAYEAIKVFNNDYFWCKEFGDLGEKGQSCGKICRSYNPKNGKSGCCKYFGNLYSKGKEIIIKI